MWFMYATSIAHTRVYKYFTNRIMKWLHECAEQCVYVYEEWQCNVADLWKLNTNGSVISEKGEL